MAMILLRTLLIRLALIATETVQGILRGLLIVPPVGNLPARKLGVPMGTFIRYALACLLIPWITARTKTPTP